MKSVKQFFVKPNLPVELYPLKELAYNYWWAWDADAKDLFARIDREQWHNLSHNPVALLYKVEQKRFSQLINQPEFMSLLNEVYSRFNTYMNDKSWFNKVKGANNGVIAYFSPEYGINESFPNYSGGLGILSGDHLKSASDLGLPMVAVGLLYQLGYFRQHLTQNGWQNEILIHNDFYSMPLTLMKKDDIPIIVDVDLKNGKAYCQIWKLDCGKVQLYLLDTNIPQNETQGYKEITSQLYGGDRETRIQQEIVLGIGGVRALTQLGIHPTVVHCNEGHAAFALLERTRMFMAKYNSDFYTAMELSKASSVFTTHTPVPAGNEVFKLSRIDQYMSKFWESLGLTREQFIELGQIGEFSNDKDFSMTVLGLKSTTYRNGVSKLHGEVARKMWKGLWEDYMEHEVPIGSVTNGIHTHTWVAREFATLFDRYLSPAWRTDTDNKDVWKNIDNIPLEEVWREKQRRRVRLVLFTRNHLKHKQKAYSTNDDLKSINEFLNPDALTIGFARRFATYKRATLLFSDMDRLSNIVKNSHKPIQILIAGKAHPHDTQGKETIQAIVQKIKQHKLEKHIVFLEDYDMIIGRLLVKGCDVWLNNPIRPLEASGTSGMKAALNGTLNFSILDGWWDEGYNGQNGFAIGEGNELDEDNRDMIEAKMLYDLLENQISRLFYDRNSSGVPEKWVEMMKDTIKSNANRFSTHRMVKDYTQQYYLPASQRFQLMSKDDAANSSKLRFWSDKMKKSWHSIEIKDVNFDNGTEFFVGNEINVRAQIDLGQISESEVIVEVCSGQLNDNSEIDLVMCTRLHFTERNGNLSIFEGSFACGDSGRQGATLRILPQHELLANPQELYVCKWA